MTDEDIDRLSAAADLLFDPGYPIDSLRDVRHRLVRLALAEAGERVIAESFVAVQEIGVVGDEVVNVNDIRRILGVREEGE